MPESVPHKSTLSSLSKAQDLCILLAAPNTHALREMTERGALKIPTNSSATQPARKHPSTPDSTKPPCSSFPPVW